MPRELMAYLGLVPSEDSTGDTIKRGPITKSGNRRARRMLVECAWSYQHEPAPLASLGFDCAAISRCLDDKVALHLVLVVRPPRVPRYFEPQTS
jgi:hypothetical protein